MRKVSFAGVCGLFAASVLQAAVVSAPNVTVSVGTIDDPLSPTLSFVDNLDGTFSSDGWYEGNDFTFDWDMTVKEDPFISGVFSFQNNSAVVQTYVFAVSLPIFPTLVPSTVHGGSIGLTLTDSNFNGAALTSITDAGVAGFQGQIDGVTVLDLFDVPFFLSVPFAGGSNTISDFDGLPGITLPSGPALSTIGIVHTFKLTPGDSASFTSFFIVEAVPEFGTFGFMSGVALVGAATAVIRRRRKA